MTEDLAAEIWKSIDSLEAIVRARPNSADPMTDSSRPDATFLRQQLDDTTRDRDNLRSLLSEVESRIAGIVSCADENDELKKKLASAEGAGAELVGRIAALESRAETTNTYFRELERARGEIQALRDSLRKCEDNARVAEATYRTGSDALKNQLAEASQAHEQEMHRQRIKLQQEAMRAEAGLQAELAISQELRSRLQKEQEANKAMKEQLDDLIRRQHVTPARQIEIVAPERHSSPRTTAAPAKRGSTPKSPTAASQKARSATSAPNPVASRLNTLFAGIPPPDF